MHDCFGTTADKIEVLKDLLVSVYLDLYSNDSYLLRFDNNLVRYIKDNTNFKWEDRKIFINDKPNALRELFPIDWVINTKLLKPSKVHKVSL